MSDFNGATWTASQLLTEVFRAARLPDTGTVDYTPTVVLRMCTDAIWNWAAPQLSLAREGRMLSTVELDVATDSVGPNGNVFRLPPMAAADALDGVKWRDPGGSERRLEVIPENMLPLFTQPNQIGSEPDGYTLLDGMLQIFPRCTAGTLVISYQRRHGELVVGSDTTVIVSTADSGGFAQPTVASTPSAFVDDAWFDVLGSTYPYRTKISGAVITTAPAANVFTTDIAYTDWTAFAQTGDTLVTYGKTPYVSLPLEMRQPLTQHIAANIMAELGDAGMVGLYDQRAELAASRTKAMLDPRTKADRPKVVNRNSLARGSMGGRRRQRTDSF